MRRFRPLLLSAPILFSGACGLLEPGCERNIGLSLEVQGLHSPLVTGDSVEVTGLRIKGECEDEMISADRAQITSGDPSVVAVGSNGTSVVAIEPGTTLVTVQVDWAQMGLSQLIEIEVN